jgi:cellulose synthase/poly-beta-1,6-N-acetylglucosamine synthase-like glycosyltransferase
MKDTLENLVAPFYKTDIVAVGGNVKVSNRGTLLTKLQTLEYISGLTLLRRCFAYLGCMQVIAGAIGAFKRDKLIEIGGYSADTICEDMDITIELVKRGYHVDYNSRAIAYTEAPENMKDFIKQRYRWVYGGFQVMKKHREVLFNPEFGELGLIGMPYFLIFPWLEMAVSVLFVVIMGEVLFYGRIAEFVFFFALTTLLQLAILIYALHMDKEDKKLSLFSIIQGVTYSHLINLITLSAGISYFRGTKTSWNKVARLGKNSVASG